MPRNIVRIIAYLYLQLEHIEFFGDFLRVGADHHIQNNEAKEPYDLGDKVLQQFLDGRVKVSGSNTRLMSASAPPRIILEKTGLYDPENRQVVHHFICLSHGSFVRFITMG